MKKLIIFLIPFLSISVLLSSCYDDKSTLPDKTIDAVEIDTAGLNLSYILEATYQKKFRIAPRYLKGGKDVTNDPDITYEWIMGSNKTLFDIDETVCISTKPILDTILPFNINNNSYPLILKVTDNTTSLVSCICWEVFISSDMKDGVVVIDTRDETTSDIHVIIDKNFTTNYNENSIIERNLFSKANKKTFPGLIKEIMYDMVYSGKNKIFLGITSSSVFIIDFPNYKLRGINEEIFSLSSSIPFKPQCIRNAGTYIAYADGGKLFAPYRNNFDLNFGWHDTPVTSIGGEYNIDNYVATDFTNRSSNYDFPYIVFFDAIKGEFCYYPGPDDKMINNTFVYDPNLDSFNPNQLPDLETLFADIGENSQFYFLMKNKTSGKYYIYTIGKATKSHFYIATVGKKIDLPTETHLNEALTSSYVFCENQAVMYYATTQKLYKQLLYGTQEETEEWTPPSGEKITRVKIFRSGYYAMRKDSRDYYIPNFAITPTNLRLLLVTTYNSSTKEGKLYSLPIINLGIGNIDKENIKEYGGFGRILEIGSQYK